MSSKDRSHARPITSAARRVLRPFGLKQRGRSRIWLADQIWYLIVVEFQPSGWSRGSYLNVGCMWLWNVAGHISHDVGHRVEEFHRFENEQQFGQVAELLVTRGLEEVVKYRRLFPNVLQVSEYYAQSAPNDFWPCFNAAVAHALSGRTELGIRVLSTCLNAANNEPLWLTEARLVARTLASMMGDQQRLHEYISHRVQVTRRLHKLPHLDHIDFRSG